MAAGKRAGLVDVKVVSFKTQATVINAIALQDWASVEQAPGVGKKLAQRIVVRANVRGLTRDEMVRLDAALPPEVVAAAARI